MVSEHMWMPLVLLLLSTSVHSAVLMSEKHSTSRRVPEKFQFHTTGLNVARGQLAKIAMRLWPLYHLVSYVFVFIFNFQYLTTFRSTPGKTKLTHFRQACINEKLVSEKLVFLVTAIMRMLCSGDWGNLIGLLCIMDLE